MQGTIDDDGLLIVLFCIFEWLHLSQLIAPNDILCFMLHKRLISRILEIMALLAVP